MTYTIPRYPVHLIDVVQMANGCRVVVRPALPQDAELQRAFVRTLSIETRYFRFMTALSELSETMAERFSSIDYRNHVALIAEFATPTGETMIGEARYVVDEHDPTLCEFAVAVADDWQRMGLARTLLGRLAEHAASAGIRRMAGDTVATNTAMVELARRSGFKVARKREDGRLTHLFKDLTGYGQRAGADRNEPAPAGVNLCAAAASTRNPFQPSVPGGLP